MLTFCEIESRMGQNFNSNKTSGTVGHFQITQSYLTDYNNNARRNRQPIIHLSELANNIEKSIRVVDGVAFSRRI